MRIVFVGPPGAGKGTQALRLKDYLGLAHLSTGEILREAHEAGTELGREAASYFEAGKLVPDDVVVSIVAERLAQSDCLGGYLFDGFPRTVAQAKALDAILAEQGQPLDLVVSIDVAARRRAAAARQSRPHRRQPRNHPTSGSGQYRSLTEPLLDYYEQQGILRSVDGTGSPEEVFARIQHVVDQAVPPSG